MASIEPNEAADAGAGHVVLLVEDEVLIRLAASDILRDEGFTVLEAASAVEALVLFSSDHPLDLVLTDVRMPGELDGLKLTQIIKEARPELPVVILSGHFDPNEEHAADAFLRKPYVAQDLLKLVRDLIDQRCQKQQASKAS